MKRMQTTQWWRVVVDSSGNATSCTAVAAAGSDDGGGVFYIQAVNALQAGRSAGALYIKAVRSKQRRLGLVPNAPSPAAPPVRREKRSAPSPIHRLPCRAAAPSPSPSSTPSKINTRLAVLIEVQEAWLQNSTIGQFTKWLNAEVEALRDRASRSA